MKGSYTFTLVRRIIEVNLILQTGRQVYRKDLAAEFGCDVQTISRLMKILCEYYPIETIVDGRETSWKIIAGANNHQSTIFENGFPKRVGDITKEEIVGLYIEQGLGTIATAKALKIRQETLKKLMVEFDVPVRRQGTRSTNHLRQTSRREIDNPRQSRVGSPAPDLESA